MAQKFGGPVLKGGGPILVSPNFVKFYLFFILTYPENFMCPAPVVKTFNFGGPVLKEISHFGTPKL